MQQIIKNLLSGLETEQRSDGEIFVTCNEESPLYKVISAMHEDMLPNDWIFLNTERLLEDFAGCESLEEIEDRLPEICDGQVNIYSAKLIDWSLDFHPLIDEAVAEYGDDSRPFLELIRLGQLFKLMSMSRDLLALIDDLKKGGE